MIDYKISKHIRPIDVSMQNTSVCSRNVMKRKIFFLALLPLFLFLYSQCFFEGGVNFLCVMMSYVCFSLGGGSSDNLFGVPEVCMLIHTEKSVPLVSWSCFLKCSAWATTYTKTWNYYMKINYEIRSKNILNHKCIDVGETSAFFFPILKRPKSH